MHLGFFPRCLIQGNRARGDPDREIVGIRGVTRGDLVLVHNGSICLRSSCKPLATRGILPKFLKPILIRVENFLCYI